MRHKLNRVVLLDCLFIVLLFLSGITEGAVSSAIYAGAFLLPIGLGIGILLLEKADPKVMLLPSDREDRQRILLSVPLASASLLCIFFFAWLSSRLLGLFGKTDTVVLTGVFWKDLLLNACIPAVGEELLFRYLPLRLLEGEDRRQAIFFSALFFALVHCNLFQLPYALVAGLLFAMIDLLSGSVLPSLSLHLINNALSVVWMNEKTSGLLVIYPIALGVLTLISLPFFWKSRKQYADRIREIFSVKSKLYFSLSAVSLTAILLYLTLSSFFN